MSKDPETLANWLRHQPLNVRGLLTRAQRLTEMNDALQEQWGSEPWMRSIRIANVRGNTLVVYANSATAIVPLRYRSQAMLAFLQQRFALNCLEIDAKVRPDY